MISMQNKSLKIAVVVHGRFYAFDLVRELICQGHDVTLFTNYPAIVVAKFGIPKQYVRSFVLHGIVSRLVHRLNQVRSVTALEPFIHSSFSTWAAQHLKNDDFDVVQVFSGVAEEVFQELALARSSKIVIRGSAHIYKQAELLEEEENRSGLWIDKPSSWMIAREEREYILADYIVVLSTFAQNSFIQRDFNPSKLKLLPLGAQLSRFRPASTVIEDRCQRIVSGQPLRVLMVGTFSLQKGAIDLLNIASQSGLDFSFRFVGAVASDANPLLQVRKTSIEFIPRQPEFELPSMYEWADLFIYTTIQDGYAVVLSQAQAAGLPILATSNCAAPDILKSGESGWILPIRDAEAFVEKLQWCNTHRLELAQMVRHVYDNFQPRDWSDVARDCVCMCEAILDKTAR
jgi:glycosyltransferase involved in cell wall biosynthesis